MDQLHAALEQIRLARIYTLELLNYCPTTDWFRMPAAGVTHIGWQVGHLAFAQYALCLRRIRGPRDDDTAIIPAEYLTHFGRGSRPTVDIATYPAPDQLRSVLDRVHAQLFIELPRLVPEQYDQPPEFQAHRIARTKLELLHWCARHEMLHAGQIGLLRRQLGHSPQW